MICTIALANLNYFRPHKNVWLFWLSNMSFMLTAGKYVVASILITGELQMRVDASASSIMVNEDGGRADAVGILLIVMDFVFLIFSGATAVIMIHTIRKKLRDEGDLEEAMGGMQQRHYQEKPQQPNPSDVVKIAPINSDDRVYPVPRGTLQPTRSTVRRTSEVQQAFSDGERHLNLKLRKMSQRASIITQSRVKARARLKQSQAMKRVPAFSELDAAAIETVVDKMEYMRLPEGSTLCREGDIADRFYVCITGECEVLIGEKKVGVIRSLDYFGEGCFVSRMGCETGEEDVALRSATVKVCSELAGFLAISKEGFQSLDIFDDHVMQEIESVRRSRERANAELLAKSD